MRGTVGATRANMRNLFLASLTSLAFVVTSTVPAYAGSRDSSQQVERTSTVARSSPSAAEGPRDEEARYAAAEQASPEVAEFTGGATLIIAASTATLVLGLILLLVLL